MCYATQLESSKSAALAALMELLSITTDAIEKRRIATTILRIPTPKPQRATGCPSFDGQPVQSTRDADRATQSPNLESGQQPPQSTPNTTPAQPTQPTTSTPNPLPPIATLAAQYAALSPLTRLQAHNKANDLLSNLSIPANKPPVTPAFLTSRAGIVPDD